MLTDETIKDALIQTLQAMINLCERRHMYAMREELTICMVNLRSTPASAATIIGAEPAHRTHATARQAFWSAYERRLHEAGLTKERAKARRDALEFGVIEDESNSESKP